MSSLSSAREAWGSDMPDWVLVLAEKSDQSSQVRVGKALNYSGSVVNAVLKGKYNGDLSAVEKAVRGKFMALMVDCPILGPLPSNQCLEHQKRAQSFSATSSVRIRLAKACKGGCPHSRINSKSAEQRPC